MEEWSQKNYRHFVPFLDKIKLYPMDEQTNIDNDQKVV